MINLVKSEILKIRSTQVWLWMVLLAVAFTALGSVGTVYSQIHDNANAGQAVNYYEIFTQSQSAAVALLVLGILGLTTEFRHKTITPTLLATPNRWFLLAGKALSYVIFSLVYALICVIVNFAIAIIWLDTEGISLDFGHGVVAGVIKAYLSLVLTALFGLGLGAIIKNQAASMVFGIVYFFILDNLLSVVPYVRKGYQWTPGGAIQAFTSNGHADLIRDDVHLLAPIAGGLLFLLWAVVLLMIGGVVSLRRDIS
jgi:ABC-2 type transport system permease protein